jgi:short-subunit dehydrogenase
MREKGRLALVTGASAGIGEAFARLLAAKGCDLVVTARRQDRLRRLAHELGQGGATVHVLPADLAEPDAPARLEAGLAALGRPVDILVNNAGYGLSGRYIETRWADQADFIRAMVTAPAELAHRLAPAMVGQGYGRIVNVASLAALAPGGPGATLYAAAKAFMVRFSESLHLELRGTGVHVTAHCPGFTYSEFHDVTGTRDLVRRTTPRFAWQDAGTVARTGWAAVEANRAVCVPGVVNKLLAAAARLTPEALALAVMARHGRRVRILDS